MTLVKWIPNRSSLNIFDDFESIFNNVLNNNHDNSWSPAFSVTEDSLAYNVYADTPGIDKKDLSVQVEDGILYISGERRAIKDNESSYSKIPRYGQFNRSFSLPDNCNGDKVTAKLKNGVLTLSIPKVEKVSNLKKVSIK